MVLEQLLVVTLGSTPDLLLFLLVERAFPDLDTLETSFLGWKTVHQMILISTFLLVKMRKSFDGDQLLNMFLSCVHLVSPTAGDVLERLIDRHPF